MGAGGSVVKSRAGGVPGTSSAQASTAAKRRYSQAKYSSSRANQSALSISNAKPPNSRQGAVKRPEPKEESKEEE
jgi:hypothetical protein